MYQRVMAALHPILSHDRGVQFFKSLSGRRTIGIVPCLEDQTVRSFLGRLNDLTQSHFAFFLHNGALRGLQVDIDLALPESMQEEVQPLSSETSLGMVYVGALNTGEQIFRLTGAQIQGVPTALHVHPISEDTLERLA